MVAENEFEIPLSNDWRQIDHAQDQQMMMIEEDLIRLTKQW